jgi:hypothetical protein
MPRSGIMFLSTRGFAPFKEKEKCLHNTRATLAKKTFSTWRPTVTLTPAQPAARPAPPLTTTKGATATFATTKVASFTGSGQTGQAGGTTARCSTWNTSWAMRESAFGQDSATTAPLDKFGAGAPVVVRRRSFLVVPAPL